MKSGWVDADAEAVVARGEKSGIDRDLALRVYTTRLLGRDRKLVLHGGGNTSVKMKMRDRFGEDAEVLRVKSSGADMATIEPEGLVAVRLAPIRKLRALEAISDEDLVGLERANLIDPAAPNPSVEMMLHAFLPHKFVDHTHATAVLSVIDQPDGEQKCAEIFGERLAFVPYLMPGFGLAKAAIGVFEKAMPRDGLILSKHGIVTFGETAREAYERMIEMVSLAEAFIARSRTSLRPSAAAAPPAAAVAQIAPIIRGACSEKDETTEGAWRRLILEFRSSEAISRFLEAKELNRISRSGVITPDHTIRTKNWPLLVPPAESGRLDDFARAARERANAFAVSYRQYFARHNKRAGGIKQELDPLPRVVLVPGLGLFGLGRSKKEAIIAADIAEAWVEGVGDAEAIGKFESISEADMFDCEYWSLEQAKLGRRKDPPLAGQIVAVTGAAGAIGAATAKAFAAAGAEVALLDVNVAAAREQAESIGTTALSVSCDVTDAASVGAAFGAIAAHFGGLDIVVSNAGAAWQGRIGEVDEEILRGEDHAGARHRRLPVVQCVETGGESGAEFRALWTAQGGAARADAPICARLWRRRHPRQCRECRPHPLRPAHGRHDRLALQGARPQREGLHERQSARPRSHRRRRGAGLPASGAGAEDHRRRDNGGRRQHRRRDAVSI